eukprot:762076-Hanusia_phi.AAC.3
MIRRPCKPSAVERLSVVTLASGAVSAFPSRSSSRSLGFRSQEALLILASFTLTLVFLISHKGLKVTMIASGMYHTACLIEGGSVFAWGRNNDGQCGMLPSEQPICYEPTEVILLRWTVVTKVACGCCHSLAITEDGKLYSWGWDNYGKIIQNQDVNIHAESPRLTEDVITIFAGLPAESQRTISNPTEVLLRNGNCYEYVVDVSGSCDFLMILADTVLAGFGFTTCITVEGGVFSWVIATFCLFPVTLSIQGFNDHGQLGNGSNTSEQICLELNCH